MYSMCFPCIKPQHVPYFCSSGERALSAAVSPGTRATFAFSRKQKKIPAALKEVTDALSWSRCTVMRWWWRPDISPDGFYLFQVSANAGNSSMSGYLQRSKGNKKQGKRLWFVIKDKVLYTYAASEVRSTACINERPVSCYNWTKGNWFHVDLTSIFFCVFMQDVAALESQPLLGFILKVDSSQKLQFKLYHKNTLYYNFTADDVQTTQRYSIKKGATYFCNTAIIIIKIIFFFSPTDGSTHSKKPQCYNVGRQCVKPFNILFTSVLSEFCTKHLETPY